LSDSSFKPAWWLPGPHAQTLWPYLLRRLPKVARRRERLELPDGDFLDLDWNGDGGGPLAVVLHGLEGSSRSHYAAGIMHALRLHGWRSVLLHFRGCSGTPNRLARGYHAGETGDLDYVVNLLRQREPATPLAIIGYSLGGNVLLKWLGEQGAQAPIIGAVAVSVPFTLANAAVRLSSGVSRLYQWSLLHRLRASMRDKWRSQGKIDGVAMLDSLRSLREFDDRVTAPLHGFAGADDYYARCSSRSFLRQIRIPTLILQARDDPFMTAEGLPGVQELPACIDFELTDNGGHVGFVSGSSPWRARYYPEQRLPAFLNAQLARTLRDPAGEVT
jgi:uncharacterized protein